MNEVTEQLLGSWREEGAVLLRGVLDPSLVATTARVAGDRYRWIEDLLRREGLAGLTRRLPDRWCFAFTASSLKLESVDEEADLEVARGVAGEQPLRGILSSLSGGPFVIDRDQAWLRRQYAPARYPPWHAPHTWHQDGALGHDFTAGTTPEASAGSGLLSMVTCWCPLHPCGRDAPGLEVITIPLDRLLPPPELTEDAVSAAYGEAARWTPQMEPGDVLLLHGGTLHRTHVTPCMTGDRTSVELRVFPAGSVPARLSGDRFSEPLGES